MSRPPLADQPARARIATELDTTFVVEAAAGTGKTSELVRRMVAVLEAGRTTLDRVVAVTFTDAAAGELKLRLRAAIERARQDGARSAAVRERLTGALRHLEEARIGTIHSFCADLLRERPVEACVDPLFQVAPEDAADELLGRAFDRWFAGTLADPPEGVRRVLRRPVRGDDGPRALLRQAAAELVRRRDFPAPWRHRPFAREEAIDRLLAEMEALVAAGEGGDTEDHFFRALAAIERFVVERKRREAVHGGRDYDGLEADLIRFARERLWRWTGWRRTHGDGPDKAPLIERRDALRDDLERFAADAGADIAPRLRDELWPVVAAYETLKERAGRLDFLDLLLRARNLVRDHRPVREELQQRFTHLFVDEFQDTDPLQAELLLLLAADDPAEADWTRVRPVSGKLFLVGDPKQSIYRFRRADVALYAGVRDRLVAAGGAALVELTTSFRAVPAIQEAINAAFAPVLSGAGSQARYVPLGRHRPGNDAQPAVIALPVPEPYGDFRTMVAWRIEASLPDAVAAFVHWLVTRSGWRVTERDRPDPVEVQSRHVCILFRRFRSWNRDVTHPYVRALEARGLPHVLLGGGSFHVREEVEAIRNALLAIERPSDELAVFATLRGPLIALNDAALLAFRAAHGSLHPFRPLPPDLPPPHAEVAQALAILRDLHTGRNRRPIADTIGRLLARTRAHAGFAIWPTGEQALANVGRLTDLARRAERSGVTSFRAFVDGLLEEAEHGQTSEAPIVEPGTAGVRLMTVHRAKGLEFPVVVLADPTAGATPPEPARWVDAGQRLCAMRLAGYSPPELLEHAAEERSREDEEAARILYVAATRARDLLVVPALGDGPQPGWLAALDPVVEPATPGTPERRDPPGCPPLGDDTLLPRPANVVRPASAVVPGLHRPRTGEHRVVWWGPAALELKTPESGGLRQRRLLEIDERGVRSDEGVRAHAAWQETRHARHEAAARPSLRVVTATEPEGARLPAGEVTLEVLPPEPGRPHGVRFGTLVHAVLAAVALDADAAGVRAVTALAGRSLGATSEEVDAAARTVERALAHPLLARAAGAAELRRETPIALRLDDGTLVEGVVDAAFREAADGGWTVVDFKTDVEIAGRLDAYRVQVGAYARAVAEATGRPVQAVLLKL